METTIAAGNGPGNDLERSFSLGLDKMRRDLYRSAGYHVSSITDDSEPLLPSDEAVAVSGLQDRYRLILYILQ